MSVGINLSFKQYPKFYMKKIFGTLFRTMFNSTQSCHERLETLINSFNEFDSDEDKRQIVKDYLTKHFSNKTFQKVDDFPLNSQWINTTSPLSIYHDLKGKLILIDFFTYCCINCMHVLPDLKRLEQKYTINDGLVVIGVHSAKFTNEKQTANIASAVKRYNILHAIMNDSQGFFWNTYNIHCWPTLTLIGPNMERLLTVTGEGHYELLNVVIAETLEIMKTRGVLSSHPLPQIKVTNELRSFGALAFPGKIAACNDGELLAVSDSGNHRILLLDKKGTVLHIIGGHDCEAGFKNGNFSEAQFDSPQGLIFKDKDTLFVADTNNHAIRIIKLSEKQVYTICGNGIQGDDKIGGQPLDQQLLSSPWDLCFGSNSNILFIAMAGIHQIWALFLTEEKYGFLEGQKNSCRAIAGSGREENRNNHYPQAAGFAQPSGLSYCSDRDSIFIADSESSAVRELNLKSGKVSAVVGGHQNPTNLFSFGDVDGVAYDVKLQHPLGVAWDEKHKKLFIADTYNHKIKVVDVFKNTCTTLQLNSKFNEPGGLCIVENSVLIADTNNHCIKSCSTIDFNLELLPIGIPSKKLSFETVNSEQTITISKSGGKFVINVNLTIPEGISLTENAPSFWSTNFESGLQEKRYEFNTNKKFEINVPSYIDKNHKFHIKGVVYICKGSVCTIEKVFFIVAINYMDTSETKVECDFNYTIPN